jgi:hypothetical protein
MDLKGTMFRISIFLLLFISWLIFACSTPSWFPIKKGPPHKAKTKEFLDKEVIIIDREEYVKVVNPKASETANEQKYQYIPINDYLLKKGAFSPALPQKEDQRMDIPVSPKPPVSAVGKEVLVVSSQVSPVSDLRKKVVITHLDDRTDQTDEMFGDIITEKLMKELDRRTRQALFVDFEMVKEFLRGRGMALTDLEKPDTLRLLNEIFGVHAIVSGHLSGPYVFTSKTAEGRQETSSAIIRIEVSLVETYTGKAIKTFSVNNPIQAAKERGTFSDEKAKLRAIDFTVSDLGRSLSRELENLIWFCRIAKVEGEEVYLNAGKLTGLKVGDILDVLGPEKPGDRETVKGKIRVSTFFGIDASIGRLIQGNQPDTNDILKLARHEGK